MQIVSKEGEAFAADALPQITLKDNRYAIFDMDGTLIDSNSMLAEISGRYLKKRGLGPCEEFNIAAKTMNMAEYAASIHELAGEKGSPDETMREIVEYTEQIYRGEVPAKPCVKQYLEKLSRQGVKLCVASATERNCIEMVLRRLELLEYFSFIITVTEVGKNKRHPTIFLEAAKRLGAAAPENVTVFEDSVGAVVTAKKAGFYVVAVYDEDTLAEELQLQQDISDAFVRSFSQLL